MGLAQGDLSDRLRMPDDTSFHLLRETPGKVPAHAFGHLWEAIERCLFSRGVYTWLCELQLLTLLSNRV